MKTINLHWEEKLKKSSQEFKHTPHLSSHLLLSGKLIVLNKKTKKAYVLSDLEILIWYLLKESTNVHTLEILAFHSIFEIEKVLNKLIEYGLIIGKKTNLK